jgi:hypothetical protein
MFCILNKDMQWVPLLVQQLLGLPLVQPLAQQ